MTDNSGVTNAPNITTNAVKKSPSSNTLDQPSQQSTLLVISGLARSSQMVEPQMIRTLVNQGAQERRRSYHEHILDMIYAPSNDIAIIKIDTPEAAARAQKDLDGSRIYGIEIKSVILPDRFVLLKQEVGPVAIDQFLAEQGRNQPTIQAPDTTLKVNKPQEDGWSSTNADAKDTIQPKDNNTIQQTDSWGRQDDSGWGKDDSWAKKSANKNAAKPEVPVTANNQQQEADPWGRQAEGWGASDSWTKKPVPAAGGRGGGQGGRGGSYGARGNSQSNNFDRRPFNNDNNQRAGTGFAEQGRNQPIVKAPDANTTLEANKPQEDGWGSTNADTKDSTQKKDNDNSQQADPWGRQDDTWAQDDSWGAKKSANKNAAKPEEKGSDNNQQQEADPWGRQSQDWGAGDSWSRKPAAGGQGGRGGSYGAGARGNSQSNNFERRSFNNDNNQQGGGYGNRRGDFVGGNRGGGGGRGGNQNFGARPMNDNRYSNDNNSGRFSTGIGGGGGFNAGRNNSGSIHGDNVGSGFGHDDVGSGFGRGGGGNGFAGRGSRGGANAFPSGGKTREKNDETDGSDAVEEQNGWGQPPKQLNNNLSQHRESKSSYNGSQRDSTEDFQPSKVVSINDIPLAASKEKVYELLLTKSQKQLNIYVGRSLKTQSSYQFALAEYPTIEEATKVVESLKEVEFMGQKLTVNYSRRSTMSQSVNTEVREAKFRNRYGDRQQYEQEQASPTSTVSSSPNRDQKEEKNIEEKSTDVQENVDNFAAPVVESTFDNFAPPVVESTLDNFAAPVVESTITLDNFAAPIVESNMQKVAEGEQPKEAVGSEANQEENTKLQENHGDTAHLKSPSVLKSPAKLSPTKLMNQVKSPAGKEQIKSPAKQPTGHVEDEDPWGGSNNEQHQDVAMQFNGGEEQVKKEEGHKDGKDKQEEGSKSKSPNLKDDPIDNFCLSNQMADGGNQQAVYEDDNAEDGWKENQEPFPEGENMPPVF